MPKRVKDGMVADPWLNYPEHTYARTPVDGWFACSGCGKAANAFFVWGAASRCPVVPVDQLPGLLLGSESTHSLSLLEDFRALSAFLEESKNANIKCMLCGEFRSSEEVGIYEDEGGVVLCSPCADRSRHRDSGHDGCASLSSHPDSPLDAGGRCEEAGCLPCWGWATTQGAQMA